MTNASALASILQMIKECDDISTIRTLILQSFTSPEIFAGFDQIKLAVQPALAAAPDGDVILRTLDLFSYGTYKDVSTGNFMTLTDAQMLKLRMLTVLTLVERACCTQAGNGGVVPYATVTQELSLPPDTLETNREVEELMIACIYAGIVHGKLCQKTRSLVVSSDDADGPCCRPRDVHNVSNMLSSLRELQKNLIGTAMSMEAEKENVEKRAEFMKRAKEAASAGNGRSTRAAAAAAGWPGGAAASREARGMRGTSMRRQGGKRSRGAGPSSGGGEFMRM